MGLMPDSFFNMRRNALALAAAALVLGLLLLLHSWVDGVGVTQSVKANTFQILVSWPLLAAAQVVPAYVAARLSSAKGWLVGLLIGALVVAGAMMMVGPAVVAELGREEGVLLHSPALELMSWALSFLVLGAFGGALGQAHRLGLKRPVRP